MDEGRELYRLYKRKYVGREELMKVLIPILNCKWNDVLHFTAISPQLIYDKFKTIDENLSLNRFEYYKIP